MTKSTRPRCLCCGKPYGQRDTTEQTFYVAEGAPIPPPTATNLVVARKRVEVYGTGRTRVRYDLWDGESWLIPYRPFCTLRCGLACARKAAEKLTGKRWNKL